MAQNDIIDLIRKKAMAAGVDPATALAVAKIESGFDPNANRGKATQYKGLFQLGTNEFGYYGDGDVFDPAANTDAFLKLFNNYTSSLSGKLGRKVTPGEAYIALQQGPAGAHALLTNPEANAINTIARFHSPGLARSVIVGNGGRADMTSREFVDQWGRRFADAASAYGGAGDPAAAAGSEGNAGQPRSESDSARLASIVSQADQRSYLRELQQNQQKQEQDRQFAGLTSQGMGLLAQGLGLSSQPQLIQAGQIHRPQMNGFAIPGLLGGSIYG